MVWKGHFDLSADSALFLDSKAKWQSRMRKLMGHMFCGERWLTPQAVGPALGPQYMACVLCMGNYGRFANHKRTGSVTVSVPKFPILELQLKAVFTWGDTRPFFDVGVKILRFSPIGKMLTSAQKLPRVTQCENGQLLGISWQATLIFFLGRRSRPVYFRKLQPTQPTAEVLTNGSLRFVLTSKCSIFQGPWVALQGFPSLATDD